MMKDSVSHIAPSKAIVCVSLLHLTTQWFFGTFVRLLNRMQVRVDIPLKEKSFLIAIRCYRLSASPSGAHPAHATFPHILALWLTGQKRDRHLMDTARVSKR
jgi:hypothetical protein